MSEDNKTLALKVALRLGCMATGVLLIFISQHWIVTATGIVCVLFEGYTRHAKGQTSPQDRVHETGQVAGPVDEVRLA